MNCQCGKEITSKITGELCTACYFKSKQSAPIKADSNEDSTNRITDNQPSIESSSMVQSDSSEELVSESNQGTSETKIKKNCPLNHDALKKELLSKGMIGQCPECDDVLVIEEDLIHQPKQSSIVPNDGKKYCQSCIERGYGLREATHEWTPNYYICDECFEPLMNNIVQVERAEVQRIRTEVKCDNPALNQIYELLGVPENLRFNSSEDVINSRNDIFSYHAQAIINMDLDAIKNRIEFLQTILFNIRYAVDPYQDYINRAKAKAREESGLSGLEKSRKETGRATKVAKLSDEEKMAKTLGMTVEKYREIAAKARQAEFDKVTKK
jgi:hypothetical protein